LYVETILHFQINNYTWSYGNDHDGRFLTFHANYKHPELKDTINFEICLKSENCLKSTKQIGASIEYINEIEELDTKNIYSTDLSYPEPQFTDLLDCIKQSCGNEIMSTMICFDVEGFRVEKSRGNDNGSFSWSYSERYPDQVQKLVNFYFSLEGSQ
jgi:hypothetical protein